MTHARAPLRALAALAALVALAAPATARAQQPHLEARALVPFPHRADALHTVVVTARPRAPLRGELEVRVSASWPLGEQRVTRAVSAAPGATRVWLAPAPVAHYDYVDARLVDPAVGAAVTASVTFGSGGGSIARDATRVAVVGLGARVAAALAPREDDTTDARLDVGTGATHPSTGEALLPTLPAAWCGADAVIAGAGALVDAPPEARAALADWVRAGGFLAVSPRTAADLRHPWLVELVGRVTDDGGGALSGERVLARRWGAVAHVGLGVVGVLPADLSTEAWTRDARAEASLRGFVDFATGAGGAMAAPGSLALYRRFATSTDGLRDAFRPPADVRGLLAPVSLALALWVIGAGLALSRNRASARPLRVFVWMPAAAVALLGALYGGARLARSGDSTARVLAVYELASASGRATERVFAGLHAGAATTFALPSPPDGFALYSAAGAASTALRWDERALGVARVRLGLWESGVAYAERVRDAGGGITVRAEGGALRLTNDSPWHLDEAVAVSHGAAFARFPAAPPGSTVTAVTLPTSPRGERGFARLFGRERSPHGLASAFLDRMVRGHDRVREAAEVWALARPPAELGQRVRAAGFAPVAAEALVRVVVPERAHDAERVGAYSSRLTVMQNDWDLDAPEAEGDADGGAP